MTPYFNQLLDLASGGSLDAVLNVHEAMRDARKTEKALTVDDDVKRYYSEASELLEVIHACSTPRQLQTLFTNNPVSLSRNEILKQAWNNRMAIVTKLLK